MVNIFFDIENTIIDDLWNCEFIPHKCDNIVRWLNEDNFIIRHPGIKCHLFTWGWKEHSEIDQGIVKNLFDRLEIPEVNRGFVWTKDDSIQCAVKHEWVNTTNEMQINDLHIPGAMKRFGLEKQTCFIQQVKDWIDFKNKQVEGLVNTDRFFLIDDTNNKEETEARFFTNKNDFKLDIVFLHPENLDIYV